MHELCLSGGLDLMALPSYGKADGFLGQQEKGLNGYYTADLFR